MKSRFITFCIVLASVSIAQANPYLRECSPDGKLEFRLEDKLRMPNFAWPRTLLSYHVRFASPPRPAQFRLCDLSTNQEVPFQLSDIHGNFAVVSFFADLPSGGLRRFELAPGAPAATVPLVKQTTESGTILLDAGKLKVRIPATQTPGTKIPGPILQINQFGDSRLVSPKRAVRSITTETIESGTLFITCRVTYTFNNNATYIAVIKAIAGYDYVELTESMTGLSKDDGVCVENAWTKFHPTHRMIIGSPFGGTRRLDYPMTQPFRGEDPPFTGPTRIEDPAVEMLPSLTPYWPNGWGGNRSASFWDEKSGDAIGLFIADASRWQDHEYAIWTSADTLKVKYRYADGTLYWKWPLVTGTRVTGLTVYHHGAAIKPPLLADQTPGAGWRDEVESINSDRELPLALQIQYGDISLDRVKDWVLDYPDSAAKPPANIMKPGRQKSLDAYMKALTTCAMTQVTKGMFHPVGLRDMGYWVVPDFLRFRDSMSPEQRSQATAVLLFTAYVAAEDEYCPMRTMLGGHPNFMGDFKFPIAASAFLFPDHPMASEWRDQFEKFMDLCGHFYVRPAVPSWEALGGRFTESIATYNWAFMGPTGFANQLARLTGARNAYATDQLADMGDYMVGILTSPQSSDNHATPDNRPQTWENGFRRIHPPQGAHSSKRGAGGSMYLIGDQLRRFRPLTAEHMMWAAFPQAGRGFEDRPDTDVGPVNRGTNPHLVSAKYTGYGIVLRAAVDTPDEIAVFLQQIDKGPNYRWGYANQNGSGDIYYYAQGRSFSGHEREEAGDGHVDDAFFSCNTGVYKDYHFSCIGMNELVRPFYNLDAAQFAEIVPQTGTGAYSWPEYQSRSVMLVGADYIIVYDRILEPCGTRFAWNICPDDEMPFIYHIKGAAETVQITNPKTKFVRGQISTMGKGGGSHMTLVTHKSDIKILPNKNKKGEPPIPYVHVSTPVGEDYVFQSDADIQFADNTISFTGSAGVIRHLKSGRNELSLFHGSRIGLHGVCLDIDNPDLGISAAWTNPSNLTGVFFSRTGGNLALTTSGQAIFYIDGVVLKPTSQNHYKLPPGQHRWEYTDRLPEPMPPIILRTENRNAGATVFFTPVPAADHYRIETSTDSGLTWKTVGQARSGHFDLTGLANRTKIHVRVIALNAQRESRPANDYPIYVSAEPPLPPEGLKTQINDKTVTLSWGEILGVTEYRLYRREKGKSDFVEIFRGRATRFIDSIAVPPAYLNPGIKADASRDTNFPVFEYVVSAVNSNGEGSKSLPTDTDPCSWRNWNPSSDLRFKRQTSFWLPPFVNLRDVPAPHYPE